MQLLKIFWPYFGELATEKNACVCFARMSFVTPHIFLGLASFHFLVISDRFISKQRSGIPSTLGEICTTHNIHTYMRECRQRMQLAIMEALASEVVHKWRHYFLFTFLTPPYRMSPTFLLKHGYLLLCILFITHFERKKISPTLKQLGMENPKTFMYWTMGFFCHGKLCSQL